MKATFRPIMHAWSIKISELLYRARTYHELRYQMFNPPPPKKTLGNCCNICFHDFRLSQRGFEATTFHTQSQRPRNEHNMLYFCGGFLVVFIKSTVACFYDTIKLLQFSDVNSTLQVQYSTSQKGFM